MVQATIRPSFGANPLGKTSRGKRTKVNNNAIAPCIRLCSTSVWFPLRGFHSPDMIINGNILSMLLKNEEVSIFKEFIRWEYLSEKFRHAHLLQDEPGGI